jgi:hypothetical protein
VKEVSRVLGYEVTSDKKDVEHRLHWIKMTDTTPISELVDNIINAGSSWVLDTAKDLIESEMKYSKMLPDGLKEVDSYSGYGVRPIVGTYSVFKENILTLHDKFGEAELTVLPKHAHLERYEFMTTDEIASAIHDHIEAI